MNAPTLNLHDALTPSAALARARRAVGWLRVWQPEGGWVLSALDPDKGFIRTRAFGPDEADAAVRWIAGWQTGVDSRNIYYQVNRDRRMLADIATKARKEDIGESVALHADLDPPPGEDIERSRKRLFERLSNPPPGVPGPPTALNFSGGGFNALWRLREPVRLDGPESVAAFEAYNIGLRDALGADSTFDVNRILRLPFTVNLPSAKKRARDRVPALAKPVWFVTKRLYSLEQFTPAEAVPRATCATNTPIGAAVSVADLTNLNVPLRTKIIIQFGSHPKEAKPSRSEWVWSAILSMLRCGVPPKEIVGILIDPEFGISESVLEKADPEAHARKQVERARDWLANEDAKEFDDEH